VTYILEIYLHVHIYATFATPEIPEVAVLYLASQQYLEVLEGAAE